MINDFSISMSDVDVLQFAAENGIIDTAYVRRMIEMNRRQEILEKHPYSIWEGKNGKWYTRFPDEEQGRKLVKRSTREKIEDAIVQFYRDKAEKETPKTFEDAYRHWRSVQDTLVSDNTIAKYDTDYKRYFKGKDFSKKRIKSVTEEAIQVFIVSTVKEQKLCKKACKTLFGYIRRSIKSARINRLIDDDPMQFLEAKQFYKYCTDVEKAPDKRIVSDEDMKRLYARFYEDYEKQPEYIPTYAVHLATLTGLRVGELAGLDWKSVTDSYIIIDKSEKYNRITKEYFIDKTKNGKNRIFPITDEIRELLDAVRKVEMQNGFICEWVFANENGRIHAPIISSCSKNKCRQIGISEKGIYAYRRTVNSKMRCNGVSATVAASLLGHTAEVNEQYYTFDVSTLQEKAEIVSNIGKRAI
jgi:integrase